MLDSMAAIGVMDTMQHTASAESTPINDRDRVSRHLQQGDIVVAVLGLTGAGKSTFISELSKDEGIVIGHSLKSSTRDIAFHAADVSGVRVWLMDTPGFDDTHLSDTEILKLYAFHFADLYERKVRLAGLLYLHRISDNRFGGSALKSLNILKMLCGGSAFSSTCLVTTFWSYVDTERGADREQELISNFWTSLLNGGARIFRHSGTTESAQRIVEMVLFAKQKSTVLAIQHEIVEKHLSLSETTVGMYLMADQEELKQKLAMKVEELKKEHAEAIQQKDAELSRELSEIRERYTEKIALAERSQSELEISWTNQRVQGDEQREIGTSWTDYRVQGNDTSFEW